MNKSDKTNSNITFMLFTFLLFATSFDLRPSYIYIYIYVNTILYIYIYIYIYI